MRVGALILFFIFFIFAASPIFAADISFSNSPPTIQKDQEVVIDVSLSGAASNTVNYIRAAFYHADSPTSYFGQVFNHQNTWYNGTPSPIDAKQFLEVQVNNDGAWSGQLKIKVDTDSSYFKGNGQYFLKVGRYTASATSVSNWSSPSQIEIQGVQPSPTLTTKPAPTEKPTNTPKPIKTPTPVKSITSAVVVTIPSEEETEEEGNGEELLEADEEAYAVLGKVSEKEEISLAPTPPVKVANASNVSSLFFISGAVILIIGCGILLVREYRKQKEEEI